MRLPKNVLHTLVSLPLGHLVADAGFGEDAGGVGGIVAQLPSQLLQQGAQRPQVPRLTRTPHPPQQPFVGHHPPARCPGGRSTKWDFGLGSCVYVEAARCAPVPYPESTEGMRRCWTGWRSEGIGMAGAGLIRADRGWFGV